MGDGCEYDRIGLLRVMIFHYVHDWVLSDGDIGDRSIGEVCIHISLVVVILVRWVIVSSWW